MDAPIVAEDLRQSYGETVALDGVSLSIPAGEVFGLVGPNGAGKTTLVRTLTGTIDPDDGAVRVLGSDPDAVARERVGLLPQNFRPHERLAARELVRYYRGLYDGGRDPDAVLADVGLADAADTRYENLSGGQQRRACVGMALVNAPDVLFLDEPTTGIDPAGRRALWRLVEDLADGGATVLLTTHDMAEAERLSDRVGLMADGRLATVGRPADLVAEHGGRPRLVVETDDDPTALVDGGFGADGGLDVDGDFEVEADADGLVIHGLAPTDIGDAVRVLEDRGVAYDSLTWREPDLEDVYLELTGEAVGAPRGDDASGDAANSPAGARGPTRDAATGGGDS